MANGGSVSGARLRGIALIAALALSFGDLPAASGGDEAPVQDEPAGAEDAGAAVDRGGQAPAASPPFPFLDDEDATASLSVGDTSHGWLVNGKQLAETDEIGILPRQKARDLAYGTAEMVALLNHVAAAVHAQTGRRLWIGDIGRKNGGDIPFSVSHNSGRDADVAFAYVGPDGAPVDPPDLVRVDARGQSKDGALRFDVARTWVVVRAILEFRGADVQFLFLAAPLKRKLLEYANAHHEPPAIVARAVEAIVQPGAAHDDHLHVRIHCGSRDLGGGCSETGVLRAWAHADTSSRANRIEAAVARLDAADAYLRRAAVQRLALLDARARAPRIAPRLQDEDAAVRGAAATALAELGSSEHEDAVARAMFAEPDAAAEVAMLGALGLLGGSEAGRVVAAVVGTEPPPCDVDARDTASSDDPAIEAEVDCEAGRSFSPAPASDRLVCATCQEPSARKRVLLAAIAAASRAERLEPVPALIALLARAEPEVRARAADALARITNRAFGSNWADAEQPTDTRDEAMRAWAKWATTLGKAPRELWVASGFLAEGYAAARLDTAHAWELVRALPRRDHIAYNAHRALERMTGRDGRWLAWDDPSACDDWRNWLVAHRAQAHVPAPPKRAPVCPRG